jgi:hypothetical protein
MSSYLSFRSSNSGDELIVSQADADILDLRVKVSSRGKAFIRGVRRSRTSVARMVAERKLGRQLRENERIGFRDRNRLNLSRDNVVIASVSDRTRYNRPQQGCSSKYKGVSWQPSRGKWYAQIRIDGRSKNLGRFDREEDAARAYDDAVKSLGISIAYQNFRDG